MCPHRNLCIIPGKGQYERNSNVSFVFLFLFFFPFYAEETSDPKEPYNNIKNYILLQEEKMCFILDFLEKLTCLETQHIFFFLLPSSNSVQRCPFGEITGSLQ